MLPATEATPLAGLVVAPARLLTGRGAVVAHLIWDQDAGGSIPSAQTMAKRLGGQKRRDRIEQLALRDGHECFYCGARLVLGAKATTIDEVVPLGRGGRARIENQVLACSPCNQDKKDMTGSEYLAKRAGLGVPTFVAHRIEQKERQRLQRMVYARRDADYEQPAHRFAYSGYTLAEVWPD